WTIGNQTWTIDNFNATRLRDGSPIPNRLEDSYWAQFAPQEPAMCWYNNDRATHEKDYGALYNWYASSHPLIAPEGWRVPTIYDYRDLAFYLMDFYGPADSYTIWSVGGYCKMPGNNFWEAPNTGADNRSLFSAKAGGAREGTFYVLGYYAVFNCADEFGGYAHSFTLKYNVNYFITEALRPKFGGYSLRLIKVD
ncbi:MAG: FISUMP domain-containing protein, partial [Bacteroidales bacterium]